MTELARVGSSLSVDVLREQIAPDASDVELAHFARVCQQLDLSPFADQIVLVGRYNSRLKKLIHRHQITVAGRRVLAERTGLCEGIEGPVWSGPRNPDTGGLEWREVWDDDTNPPYCARTLVYKRGWRVPANGTAKWSEFAQTDSGGKLIPPWAQMPSHLLGKVSESLALRRAFADVIDPAIDADYPTPVDPDEEDLAELNEATAEAELDTDSAVRIHADPHTGRDLITADAGPLEHRAGEWRPTLDDQGDAHRIIGALDDDSVERFLADWRIDDFSAAWPADAVADALARPK